jgi:hypothetical protein
MSPLSRSEAIATATAPGQAHELVDQVIDGRALRVFARAPRSLRALFEAGGHRPALPGLPGRTLQLRRELGAGRRASAMCWCTAAA